MMHVTREQVERVARLCRDYRYSNADVVLGPHVVIDREAVIDVTAPDPVGPIGVWVGPTAYIDPGIGRRVVCPGSVYVVVLPDGSAHS